ncbi:MAG: hypothetical protein ACRD0B_03140, partial [Acidimicrobiales bacterium]
LVEPMNIGVTPLAFLAIGAAAAGLGRPARLATSLPPEHAGASSDRRADDPAPYPPRGRWRRALAAVTALVVVAALFVGVTMIAGDYFYTQAKTSTFNESNPTRANTLWPYWPESATVVAFDVWQYRAALDHAPAEHAADLRQAVVWWRRAAARDPGDPSSWSSIGVLEQQIGNRKAAAHAYGQALRDYPWTTAALEGYASLEKTEHHYRAELSLYSRLSVASSLTPTEEQNAAAARRALAAGR